jgi:hypothetical protein
MRRQSWPSSLSEGGVPQTPRSWQTSPWRLGMRSWKSKKVHAKAKRLLLK